MDNKIFKEMIKKHLVKQSFVRIIDNDTLLRFYQNTTNDDKYIVTWKVNSDNKTTDKSVSIIEKGEWVYHWHKYAAEVEQFRKTGSVSQFGIILSSEEPMYRKKFDKIQADTLKFMLKDERIRYE